MFSNSTQACEWSIVALQIFSISLLRRVQHNEGKAAQFALASTRSYIERFESPICFTGHSYSGTVAPVVEVIVSTNGLYKDMNSIGLLQCRQWTMRELACTQIRLRLF
jgi:hypothetical protein